VRRGRAGRPRRTAGGTRTRDARDRPVRRGRARLGRARARIVAVRGDRRLARAARGRRQTEEGKHAGHMLADAALLAQQFAGVATTTALAEPGRAGIVAAASRADPLLIGLSGALAQGRPRGVPGRDCEGRPRPDRLRQARPATRRARAGHGRHSICVVDGGPRQQWRARLQPGVQHLGPARALGRDRRRSARAAGHRLTDCCPSAGSADDCRGLANGNCGRWLVETSRCATAQRRSAHQP